MKKRVLVILAIIAILICINISQTQTILKNLGSVVMQKFYEDDLVVIESDDTAIGTYAKISSSIITKRITGVGPFDEVQNTDSSNLDGSVSWTAGDDTSETDEIVRSFDQITWTIENTMILKESATVENVKGGVIEISATLPEECANLVEWDLSSMMWAEDAVLSEDGRTFSAKYTMTSTETTVPGKQTLIFVLKVLGASNGLEITPTFTINLQGNSEEDYVTVVDSPVYASATPSYNVVLRRDTTNNERYTLNVDGEEKVGRLYGYILMLQLYNNDPSKGLKGIEYPQGKITFDMNLLFQRSDFSSSDTLEDITDESLPILWNYSQNCGSAIITDRTMGSYTYSKSGPRGILTTDRNNCVYNSGNILMEQNGRNVTVTISDYDFDGIFPSYNIEYNESTAVVYKDNVGCFNSTYFQLFVPDTEANSIDDRNYYLTVSNSNFSATTVSGTTTTTQQITSDDSTTLTHVRYVKGSYGHFLDLTNFPNCVNRGRAGDNSVAIGEQFTAELFTSISSNADPEGYIYDINKLFKFDGEGFEPTNQIGGTSSMSFNHWYLTKKDGTNWISQSEMNETVDLTSFNFYENLSDIPEGDICIGMFFESISGTWKPQWNSITVRMKVKDTANINQTYGLTHATYAWNMEDKLDRSIYTYKNNGNLTYPNPTFTSEKQNYIKTEYDEDGKIVSGTHSGSYGYGNTVLVIGADLSITKEAVDTSTGETKVNYDFSKNEFIVDYEINPILNSDTEITDVNLKITDTLPDGMDYVAGSCDYNEPEIVYNEDGSSTLIWYLYGVSTNSAITPIKYKAHIDEMSGNGKQYDSSVVIEEVANTDSYGNIYYKIGNVRVDNRTYSTSIQVINLSSYSLYKSTETPVIEVNGDMHYKITAINKTDEAIPEFQLLDILPYNGDDRGTSYSGSYTIEKIELLQTNIVTSEIMTNENMNLFITTDESVRSGVTAKDENLGQDSIWTTASSGETLNQILTAYALVGELNAREKLEIDIYLKTNGNKPYDNYKNSATAQTSKNTDVMETSVIAVQDVKRQLDGYVWFDSNKDGLITNGEEFLPNINVTLLNEDGTIAKDIDGNEISSIQTDDSGYYHFEDMVMADYKVKIDLTDINHEMTMKTVGANNEINSKFNEDGTTDVIKTLNSIDSPLLKESYVNAGITYKDTSVIVHHYIEGTTTPVIEDVIINGKVNDNYETNVSENIPEYYEVVNEPANYKGIMTLDTIEVIYYYKLKKYDYTVNYLEKDSDTDDTNNIVLSTAKNVSGITYGTEIDSKSEIINITGYNYDSINKDSLIIDTENNVINIYYTKGKFNYTVEYYYNDIIENSKTEILEATYQDEIVSYTDKLEVGYKLKKEENLPLVITENSSNNIIKVYYETDETQTKELNYEVEYYKDGEKIDSDTQTVTATVQILEPDTLNVDKTQINTTNKYTGYKLEKTEPETIPDVVNTGEIIKVYYVKDQFEYTVEYYYDGVKDESKTENLTATYQEVIDTYTDKNITGYKLEKEENLPLTITEIEADNVIKVYYVKDQFEYTVEYYYDGVKDDIKTESLTGTYQEVIDTYTDKNITGYKLEKEENLPLTITEVEADNVIKVYYVKDQFEYTVEYYYDGVKDESKTENLTGTYQEVIDTYTNKNITGYKLEKEENLPLTIAEVEADNVIKVYYVIDDANTKTLSYTVEYYKDGEKIDSDTQTVTATVQILQPDTLNVDKTQINTSDKYVGYKLEKTEPETIPDVVNTGEIIKVYYVKDQFEYTVEYYYDGTKDESKTENLTGTYQEVIDTYTDKNITGYKLEKEENLPLTITEIEADNVIKVYYEKDKFGYTVEYYYDGIKDESKTENLTGTYQEVIDAYTDKNITGYKLEKEENLPLTITEIEADNVIKVYYVIDDANTKTLSYTVEYYKDGEKIDSDTQTVTATVQILQPDILNVDKTQINTTNKYTGYRLEKTEPETIPDVVNTGEAIKVYYVKDQFEYTVEYYYDGIKDDSKTENLTGIYQEVIDAYTDKNITGYKLEKEENLPLTITEVEADNVIKVYYVIDDANTKTLSYTVEYYKDGEKIDSDTQTVTATVQILQPDILNVDKTQINTTNKYTGYMLEKTNPETIPDVVNTGEVIKVYYVKDQFEYTVEYYYDGVKDESKTENLTGTYQDKITTYTDKNITGYKLEKEENLPLTITEVEADNVIKVYYVIDDANTKTLSYTVEYYKDGEKIDSDTQTVTATVQILEPDTLNVDKTQINTTNKYTGYMLEKTNPETIPDVVNTGEVIKVYYVKDQFEYTVEYYYDGIKDDSKTENLTATYQDKITTYIDKNIKGYKLEKEENLPLIISEYEELNKIKIYYVKNSFGYAIEYYYDNILDTSKTETYSANYEDIINSYTDKTIYGYEFEKINNFPLTISENTDYNIISVYYVKKDAEVSVKYIDKDTGEEIADEETKRGKVFDSYDVSDLEKQIDGYTMIEKPEDVTGTYTEEKQEKIYYYAKNSNIIVKYLEKNTEKIIELSEQTEISGYQGKEYITEPKNIQNYTVVEDSGNTSGVMTTETIEVIYYYLQNTKVIVNHIDKNTEQIMDVVEQEGLVGEEYNATSKSFDNYVLIEKPENENVIMTKEIIILNYYYVHVSAGVIEKHIDIMSGEILYNELYEGNAGDLYTTNLKEFEGYDVVTNEKYYTNYIDKNPQILEKYEVSNLQELLNRLELNPEDDYIPSNYKGIMEIETISVEYYYIRRASVKVTYIDKITGEEIPEVDEQIGEIRESKEYIYGHEGDNYKTEEKYFENYVIVEEIYPENAEGKMQIKIDENGILTSEIEVKYYYIKVSGGVIEKHIDIKSGNIIEEANYIGVEHQEYTTNKKEFEGYDIVTNKQFYEMYIKENPEILANNNVENTESLLEKLNLNADDEYIPENYKGTMLTTVIEVKYYYIRRANVIVEYIDKNTGELIPELVEIDSNNPPTYKEIESTEYLYGQQGDYYTTVQKDFKNYKLNETTNNTEGTMEVKINDDGTVNTTIHVQYYYVHNSSGVRVQHIDIITGELIEKETKYDGCEGDNYNTNPKEFENYDLIKEYYPENANGKMTIEEIQVKYFYIRKSKIIVKHLEIGTNKKLTEDEIITGHEGDSYNTNSKNINGFNIVDNKLPKNKSGKMTKDDIIVIYYYDAQNNGAMANPVIQNNNNVTQNSNNKSFDKTLNSTNSTDVKTGDITPIIALNVIILIVVANMIQIRIQNKSKKRRSKGKRYIK